MAARNCARIRRLSVCSLFRPVFGDNAVYYVLLWPYGSQKKADVVRFCGSHKAGRWVFAVAARLSQLAVGIIIR